MIVKRNEYITIYAQNTHEVVRLRQFLEARCLYENPEYEKKTKRLSNVLFTKVPKQIRTYQEEKHGNFTVYKVMKANKNVYEELLKLGFPIEFIDERVNNPCDINALVGPRDEEQRKAIDSIINNQFGYGILSASPSAGKTIISLMAASKFKQRTLVLVDMVLLIDQFIDSILTFTDIKENEIGFIRGPEKEYKDKKIVIATMQTLSKKENEHIIEYLNKNIGFIICDEVHVMSCMSAQNILKRLKPKYMLGLSGTPHRDDKMDFYITQSVGPIIHQSNRQAMVDAGSMVTPLLRPIFLQDDTMFQKYNIDKEVDFRDVVDLYYNSPKAIDKISNLICHHYNNDDSQLVVCKEVSLVKEYYAILVKKIFGKSLENTAKREKEYLIAKEYEKLKKIDTYTYKDCIKTTDKVKLDMGRVTEEELIVKYKDILSAYKEERANKIERKIQNLTKKEWYEMPCVTKIPNIESIKIFTGSTSKKERDKIINEVNSGKIKIVLCTTVMDKAISINRLNILYLTFSTRERANTIQRVGRISRAFKNKKPAIVYDIIYDHYMSYYQFINGKGECRMAAYQGFVKIHPSIALLQEYLEYRFKQRNKPQSFWNEWEKWKNKYVVEL